METADRLFINGRIYTMDSEDTKAQALAVKDDTIIEVGDTDAILSLRGANTEVIDLSKKAVIPGLIDSHTHIFWAGISELDGEMFMPQSIKELIEYIRKTTKEIPKGQWIHLKNVYPTRLKEYRYPTVDELDRVSPDHPVFIDGAYAGRANSHAMKTAKIDNKTPMDRAIASIKKHLKENEHSLEEHKEGIKNIQIKYNRFGITSIIDGISSKIGIKAVNSLYKENKLSIRMAFTKVVSNTNVASSDMANFQKLIELPGKWGKLAFMKILLDGGILTGTSYMRRPYIDDIGIFGMKDGFRGIINYDSKTIEELIEIAYQEQYQMTAHCIGDGALDILLKAYENYQENRDITDRRYSIIHADFTDDMALETINNLGLVLLFQPAWHLKDAAILREVLDDETFKTFLPYKRYVDVGIKAAAGSDHMVKYDPIKSQNPYHPFWALYNMVTCKTFGGNQIGKQYSINRKDALRFYTIKGAYATFDEDIKGSLEPGKLADFAVLSKDYFTCPEYEIPNIESVHTVVGGKTVYSS